MMEGRTPAQMFDADKTQQPDPQNVFAGLLKENTGRGRCQANTISVSSLSTSWRLAQVSSVCAEQP